jgi:hypothetical protein
MLKKIIEVPKKSSLILIRLYQKTLSFDHSFWAQPEQFRVCIHYPSCSQYTYEAIEKYGLIKGGLLGGWRVIRCNPFAKGGYDPVP